MTRVWSGLFKDTLTKRLFLLIWAALLLSHVIGFWSAFAGAPGWRPTLSQVPPVPSMPPLPRALPGQGMPPGGPREGMGPERGRLGEQGGPEGNGAERPRERDQSPGSFRGGMPFGAHPNLWLDYFVRIVVTGAAAWLGARWLTAPMRRLADASGQLSQSLVRKEPLPQLDEHRGTLEVRQTAQVFNAMARQLQDQFDERSLLMAAVSHDLRTPLTRLRMRLERLRPDPVAERCVEDVQDVNAMIEAVLDALNEERRQEPPQTMDVLSLVQAMADDMAEEGQPVTAEGDSATIQVQPVAFKRILGNLVGNAIRYGQQADIRVRRGEGRVHICVDDQGPGIPADLIAAVFKPFVRLETSRNRDTGGVGLGLYIARELTLRNGGQITLSNRREGGLRAEVSFPLHPPEA